MITFRTLTKATALVSFPLITEPVILTFCNKNWEFCDGPEALFRRRHLEVVA